MLNRSFELRNAPIFFERPKSARRLLGADLPVVWDFRRFSLVEEECSPAKRVDMFPSPTLSIRLLSYAWIPSLLYTATGES